MYGVFGMIGLTEERRNDMNRKVLFTFLVLTIATGLVLCNSVEALKPYHIEIRGARFGGSSYIMAFAAADILNKKSSWVRASALESVGAGQENIRVVGADKKKRARTVLMCDLDMFSLARSGKSPFEKNPEHYRDLMVMRATQRIAHGYLTLDPAIKNIADLKGKRFATWPKGTLKNIIISNAIGGAGEKVLKSIKWQYSAFQGYDDMLLGKVDAVFGFFPERGDGRYVRIPAVTELYKKKKGKVYLIGFTPEQRARSGKLYGENWSRSILLPANSIEKGVPSGDLLTTVVILSWSVYPDMPKDVVYEIVKVLDENCDMFGNYHKAGVSLKTEFSGLFPVAKELWHPGARKYLDEKNIPYGAAYWEKKRGK